MTLKQKARYSRLQALSTSKKPRSATIKGRVTHLATRLNQVADELSTDTTVPMHTLFMAA